MTRASQPPNPIRHGYGIDGIEGGGRAVSATLIKGGFNPPPGVAAIQKKLAKISILAAGLSYLRFMRRWRRVRTVRPPFGARPFGLFWG